MARKTKNQKNPYRLRAIPSQTRCPSGVRFRDAGSVEGTDVTGRVHHGLLDLPLADHRPAPAGDRRCAASNEPRAASCAGTAGLCLTTSADAAAVPCGSALRMLADDEFQTAAGGLRMPALHPAIEREQVRQVARSCLNPAAAEWWLDPW